MKTTSLPHHDLARSLSDAQKARLRDYAKHRITTRKANVDSVLEKKGLLTFLGEVTNLGHDVLAFLDTPRC
jgi:hypothetical protein